MHLITVFLCNALFLLVIRYSLPDDLSVKAYFCQLLESNFVFETSLRSVGRLPYVEEWKTNLMSLAILFHLLCAQHVSDINMSISRSLRLCWWITTSVVLFSVRCVLELLLRLIFGGVRFAGFSFVATDIWWCSFCRLQPAKCPKYVERIISEIK